MYMAFNHVHQPDYASQKFCGVTKRGLFGDVLAELDWLVGDILSSLDATGERNNTAIFFSSDNGPSRESRNWLDGKQDPYYGGKTGMLRGNKFSLFDGGIKLPAIMHWPGKIPSQQVSTEVCASMDVVPTILDAVGIDYSNLEIDGKSLLPHLINGKKMPDREIFWEMQNQKAVRKGKWKLVLNGQLVENEPKVSNVHLANLESDPGERINLADKETEVKEELMHILNQWTENIENEWENNFPEIDYSYVANGMV